MFILGSTYPGSMSLVALTTGLLTAMGLLVAIGAQNAYLLRLGTTRRPGSCFPSSSSVRSPTPCCT
jgi:hypothetical protein